MAKRVTNKPAEQRPGRYTSEWRARVKLGRAMRSCDRDLKRRRLVAAARSVAARARRRALEATDRAMLEVMADGAWRGSPEVRAAMRPSTLKAGPARLRAVAPRLRAMFEAGRLERTDNPAFDQTKPHWLQREPVYLYRITSEGRRWLVSETNVPEEPEEDMITKLFGKRAPDECSVR